MPPLYVSVSENGKHPRSGMVVHPGTFANYYDSSEHGRWVNVSAYIESDDPDDPVGFIFYTDAKNERIEGPRHEIHRRAEISLPITTRLGASAALLIAHRDQFQNFQA